ncbi:MoaD/ThiS family protein [Clostridia bacterium]|nr:MoaD/ThiS family protein [Clostridia bacterium]
MLIKLRLLGFFQMMLGTMYLDMELPEGSTAHDLWQNLVNRYVQLQKEDMSRIAGMSLNGEYKYVQDWPGVLLHDGDEVDLLTQMGGG